LLPKGEALLAVCAASGDRDQHEAHPGAVLADLPPADQRDLAVQHPAEDSRGVSGIQAQSGRPGPDPRLRAI